MSNSAKSHRSVKIISSIGDQLAKRLNYLGISTIQDLILHTPFRYEDYSKIAPIAQITPGEPITVRVRIDLIAAKRSPRKHMIITEAVVSDDSGQLKVIWFGQLYIAKTLKAGDEIYLSGVVTKDVFGLQFKSPTYEKIRAETAHTARIIPIYSTTAGITQKQLRHIMNLALEYVDELDDWMPEKFVKQSGVISYDRAIRSIHFPKSFAHIEQARKRFAFEELFLLQLRSSVALKARIKQSSPQIEFKKGLIQKFVQSLPFTLTDDQKKVAWVIMQDMSEAVPMYRLVQGDVGSGKTVVAAMVLYHAFLSGYKAVLMAPTDVLVQQHYQTMKGFLGGFCTVGIFTRTQKFIYKNGVEEKLSKKKFIEALAAGDIDVVVGTHALLSQGVEVFNLGVVVVDEQHRFGVEQRKTIGNQRAGDSGLLPHYVSMTATPIPRSFALAMYGDLAISTIHQMPKGRKQIITQLIESRERDNAYQLVAEHVKAGRQVFVICPIITPQEDREATGTDERKSVLAVYEHLSKEVFPQFRVGFLHGKLKAVDKKQYMEDFVNHKIDILVATSVVEVGVDVPNASVMIIEDAERFGLAQLHQFRGRIGRGEHQSYCLVFTKSRNPDTLDRLGFFENNADGFVLAEYDLQRRGPGEVYGTQQSGVMQFKFARVTDTELIEKARSIVRDLDLVEYPILQERFDKWEQGLHLE